MRLILSALLSLFVATQAVSQTPIDASPPAEAAPAAPEAAAPEAAATEAAAPVPEAPAAPEATGEVATGELRGRIVEDRYYSATNAFDIVIPVMVGEDTLILDTEEIVVFRDGVRTMLTIAAIHLDPLAKWELDTTSRREYLIRFFRENVLANYTETFPGSTVESARLIGDLEKGALMVNTLHPNGSAFETDPIVRNDPATPPPVAKRGNLLFCHGDFIYVISTELADRVTEMSTYSTDTETEDRILRDRLLAVHEQLHFTEAPSN
jgi:hypothetical protein